MKKGDLEIGLFIKEGNDSGVEILDILENTLIIENPLGELELLKISTALMNYEVEEADW